MTHPKMSDSAVEKATGHSWGHWFSLLDALGAQQMSHKAIAHHLHTREGVAGWWAQSITVAYERARGMREVGETTRGFQVSKQKTFMPDAASAWELLLSPRGLASWLGDGAPAKLDEEQRFELADGTRVQVRGIRHGEQIRLGWEPADTSTTQVLVVRVETSASGKGTVSFTRENLPDERARDDARTHLSETLQRLATLSKSRPSA